MGSILEGVRIIDFMSSKPGWLLAPLGTAYLGDMGAEVIRIDAKNGDSSFEYQSLASTNTDESIYYDYCNRNKKSIILDVNSPKGADIVRNLIARSDVFATNMPRTALKKLSMDYQTLSQINQKLVYAVASGFGRYGPDKDETAIDECAASRAGLMPILGEPGQPPIYTGVGEAITAIDFAFGVMVALFHRARTGDGQEMDTSLFAANILFEACLLQTYIAGRAESMLRQLSRKESGNPLFNLYRTKDKWLFFAMPQTDIYWHNFCKGLEHEDLERDPRFDTHAKRTGENRLELIKIIDDILSFRTLEEWSRTWQGLGFIYVPVAQYQDILNDPQVVENQYVVKLNHPTLGKIEQIGFPVLCSKTPPRITSPSPAIGQHTIEIITNVLGYTMDDINRLSHEGIIITK